MSIVRRMDHFTIVTDDVEKTKEFYAHLGLHPGDRPNFAVDGCWMYGAEGLMRTLNPFRTWQLFFPDPNGVEVEIDFAPSEPQPADWKGNVMRERT